MRATDFEEIDFMAVIILLHEDLVLKKFPVQKPELIIGRRLDCDITIDDKVVSKSHAVIKMRQNPDNENMVEYFIKDLESTNHTYVNGDKISHHKLAHNDLIRIGRHALKFLDESVPLTDNTVKLHKSWIPGVFYTKE